MAKKKTLPATATIFETALGHLEADGPKAFSLEHVADALNVEPGLLAPLFNDLPTLAASFGRFVDQSVAEEISVPAGGEADPAIDRLFEVLMARFDVIQKYRGGVLALAKAARRDRALLAVLSVRLPHSMEHMLTLADLLTSKSKRGLQVAGLTGLWLRCTRVWMKDDSEDMSKTMAALDKALKDADSIARRLF